MKRLILDIFCGTKSVKKICDKNDYEYIGLDINNKCNPDICCDFLTWDYKNCGLKPDLIWLSPDCSVFSMASGNTHWDKNRNPKTEKAKTSLLIIARIKEVIEYFKCDYVIENPRARMRWFITEYPRYTVSYCQYGFDRMKPTDIWTSVPFNPKMCHNGATCHISAPRGSRSGTQNISLNERYKIPEELIEELI